MPAWPGPLAAQKKHPGDVAASLAPVAHTPHPGLLPGLSGANLTSPGLGAGNLKTQREVGSSALRAESGVSRQKALLVVDCVVELRASLGVLESS